MRDTLIKHVQDMYDQSGKLWNNTRSKKYGSTQNWPVIQKYLDQLAPNQTLLDVGCGNGRLISGLPDGVRYIGVDFSRTLLEEAITNYPGYDFRFGNIVEPATWATIPMCDAVFCIATLHHLPEKTDHLYALRQMKSHASHGGTLVLSVWNLWHERFLQSHLESAHLKRINERWLEVPFAQTWKRFCYQMDIPYLIEISTDAGWTVDDIYFAHRDGTVSDIQTGDNLILIAH